MSEEVCLRDTIVPKSDQLNYDDVVSTSLTVKITGMKKGSAEQPVIVNVADRNGKQLRDYKPCKSMRRVLVAVWGDKGSDWIGQCMTLTADHNVKFGGAKVGGIVVSHVSGIDAPVTIMLTVTRSKRKPYTVQPFAAPKAAAA